MASMTGELLLELLSEEIPARMQRRAIEDLTALLRDKLAAAEIPPTDIAGYVTPRRLTVIAGGIPARQPDREEERRGPRVGAPDAAIGGFLRGAGLRSIEECEVRATDRGEFYFAVIKQPGRATGEVLPELILAALAALPWPKSMRYPASPLRWVRPLNSVICLFDGDVINLGLGEVPVGRLTCGHRFLSPGEITVADAADYREKLAGAHVVLDRDERRAIIARDLAKLAEAEGLTVKSDEGLLDEVTGLVEYPVGLMGSIDADFVRPLPEGLPPEVLATAMRTHQKYFSCLNPDGTPAPRFLFVANNKTPDDGRTITEGNERVLRARLADARFFWDQDRKVSEDVRIEALKTRIYHERIGNEFDRRNNLINIAGEISSLIWSDENTQSITVAASGLANNDLCTGTVGEFPELQGIVGGYLVLSSDGDPQIAAAIANQYKPVGPTDKPPSEPASINVALATKIDALVGFFGIGEKPTGSRDPFGLRRAALGVIRTILENGIRLKLTPALMVAAKTHAKGSDVVKEVLEFIAERLKVHLRERGVRHDLVSAIFALNEDDLVRLLARVDALREFLDSEDGANLLIAYRRASNIVGIEEKRDGVHYGPPNDAAIETKYFIEAEERALWDVLGDMIFHLEADFISEDFGAAMARLSTLRRPVDDFFEKVTVNAEAPELRVNRLRLLARIRFTMSRIADFSQIEG
jgi:glycyl-tRNA synthetase beta chain